jgi:hypothetical protein
VASLYTEAPLLTREQEALLFREMNYLKYRAAMLRESLDPAGASASELDEIERLQEEAMSVKNQTIRANFRLVVSIAKRRMGPGNDLFELVSDGNMSLIRGEIRLLAGVQVQHLDPVRSSHAYTAWKYGHRWVVLAMLVRFPWATRPWALPVLVDLYRSEEEDRRRGRPHRTPAQLMCRLLRALMIRCPGRRFAFVGDLGYGTHEIARFFHRHRRRLDLVSKVHPEANLFDPPPPCRGVGRPRVKGGRRPKPREAVASARRRRRLTVGWYGGGTRRVSVVTGTGHGYKAGAGLVPIRWVHVRDLDGTHRDEYFYATDPALDPAEIVTRYAGRWNIECTFQECRSHLRSETTRGRCRRTVSRATPCLFGLYSVVALLFHALPEAKRSGGVRWPGKAGVSFSDALASVRLWVWSEGVFPRAASRFGLEKLPNPLRELLRSALAPAA